MKKLVLSMAVVAATVMVSCGSKSDANAEGADSTAVEIVEPTVVVEGEAATPAEAPATAEEASGLIDKIKEVANNPEEIKTYVEKGIAYAKNLISAGKLQEAKGYLAQLKPYADKVNLGKAVESVEALIDKADVAGKVDAAKDGAKAAGQAAVDDAKAKASAAVEDAKNKAADKVSDAIKNLGK